MVLDLQEKMDLGLVDHDNCTFGLFSCENGEIRASNFCIRLYKSV